MLQGIHGPWFFRYPDQVLAEAHRRSYFAPVFVLCPMGHDEDVQPFAGM